MHKDLKKIEKALHKQGFTTEVTGRGHLVVYRDGRRVSTFSGTPGDGRAWRNALTQCKRAGFTWPPRR